MPFQQNNTSCPVLNPSLIGAPAQPAITSVQVAGETIPVNTKMLSLPEAILGHTSAPQEAFHLQGKTEVEANNPRSVNPQDEEEVTSRV